MRRSKWASAAKGNEEKRDGEERDCVAEALVGGVGVGDGHGGEAGGDRDCDETVATSLAGGDEGLVEGDAPGGVVAEIEDEGLRSGGVEREAGWGQAGCGVGGGLGVGVG